MKPLLRNTLKNGLALFAVGVVLAFAAPALASLVHVSMVDVGITAKPLWTGAFFGAFGAVNTVIGAVFDKLFSNKTPAPQAPSASVEKALQPEIALAVEPEQNLSEALGKFTERAKDKNRSVAVKR